MNRRTTTTGTDTTGNRAGVSRAGKAGAGEAGVRRAGIPVMTLFSVPAQATAFLRLHIDELVARRDSHMKMMHSRRPFVSKEYHKEQAASCHRQITYLLWLLDRPECKKAHTIALREVALTPAQRKQLLD